MYIRYGEGVPPDSKKSNLGGDRKELKMSNNVTTNTTATNTETSWRETLRREVREFFPLGEEVSPKKGVTAEKAVEKELSPSPHEGEKVLVLITGSRYASGKIKGRIKFALQLLQKRFEGAKLFVAAPHSPTGVGHYVRGICESLNIKGKLYKPRWKDGEGKFIRNAMFRMNENLIGRLVAAKADHKVCLHFPVSGKVDKASRQLLRLAKGANFLLWEYPFETPSSREEYEKDGAQKPRKSRELPPSEEKEERLSSRYEKDYPNDGIDPSAWELSFPAEKLTASRLDSGKYKVAYDGHDITGVFTPEELETLRGQISRGEWPPEPPRGGGKKSSRKGGEGVQKYSWGEYSREGRWWSKKPFPPHVMREGPKPYKEEVTQKPGYLPNWEVKEFDLWAAQRPDGKWDLWWRDRGPASRPFTREELSMVAVDYGLMKTKNSKSSRPYPIRRKRKR